MKFFSKTKPSFATDSELERLRDLNTRWQAWSARMERYSAERVGLDYQTARENFIADPCPEHEQNLLICADTRLLGIRYQCIRDACQTALGKLAYELRDIMVPILDRKITRLEKKLQSALQDEAQHRATEAERGMHFASKVNDPVPTLKRAISQTHDQIRNLNELSTSRTPAQWALMIGI